VARERYLLNGGEETIHQPRTETGPKTPKSSWDNFWYYHKWHVIIGAFLIFVVLFFVYDMTSKVNPDYEIGLITETTYPSEMVDALQTEVAKYGEDRNGDGKVIVSVNNYVMQDDASGGMVDPNVRMAGYVKVTNDLSNGTSMIFITDDKCFRNQQDELQMFTYLDGSKPAENAKDYDKMRVSLADCKRLADIEVNGTPVISREILKNLSISMRTIQDTQLEKQQDKTAYYAASKKLFDEITKK
jgi:hypothetical protein